MMCVVVINRLFNEQKWENCENVSCVNDIKMTAFL
jgi:hypothetical protein